MVVVYECVGSLEICIYNIEQSNNLTLKRHIGTRKLCTLGNLFHVKLTKFAGVTTIRIKQFVWPTAHNSADSTCEQ